MNIQGTPTHPTSRRRLLESESTPKCYQAIEKCIKTTDSMKDSGIGTTYLTVSSGSSSTNTSPESEKDALNQNGKSTKSLDVAEIDATSTPATVRTPARTDEVTICDVEGVRSPLENGQKCFFLETDHFRATPITVRKREAVDKVPTTPGKSSGLRITASKIMTEPTVTDDQTAVGEETRRRQRRMHDCSFCGKQFDRPSLLKRHTLTHTGERPFACRFCSKGFSTRSGVNTHERTHTGQRPYVCTTCGRRFAAGSNLIFHKYTHSNTRRHQCAQCPKAFVTPGDLRKHEYTHTDKWPFRCTTCDRGFATERNLRSHEVTHTGQKPFKCPVCSKTYAQESSMKTHLRTHQRSLSEDGDNGMRVSPAATKSTPDDETAETLVMPPPRVNRGEQRQTGHLPHSAPTHHSTFIVSQRLYSADTSGTPCVLSPASRAAPSAFTVPPQRQTMRQIATPTDVSQEIQRFYERYMAYYAMYMDALVGQTMQQPQDPAVCTMTRRSITYPTVFSPWTDARQQPASYLEPRASAHGQVRVPLTPQPIDSAGTPQTSSCLEITTPSASNDACNDPQQAPEIDPTMQLYALDFSLKGKKA
ncbi:unnamed protein product [Dicrocoelium dendriticum]|nr:unnamed protein product [Dicrocoelium dendriticum]